MTAQRRFWFFCNGAPSRSKDGSFLQKIKANPWKLRGCRRWGRWVIPPKSWSKWLDWQSLVAILRPTPPKNGAPPNCGFSSFSNIDIGTLMSRIQGDAGPSDQAIRAWAHRGTSKSSAPRLLALYSVFDNPLSPLVEHAKPRKVGKVSVLAQLPETARRI